MSRTARRPGLPLAVWAALLGGTAVLATVGTAALVLALTGRADVVDGEAVVPARSPGCCVVLVRVAGASRLAAAPARRCTATPCAACRPRRARRAGRAVAPLSALTGELAELARVLDALHLRVRVADELGERHRARGAERPARACSSCCPAWSPPRRAPAGSSPPSCTTPSPSR